jgi:UDP-glucose:glycoprotein glucosyltransferase
LTLDRSSLNNSHNSRLVEEILVEPDGSVTESEDKQKMLSAEHTDTLVMKTVGYWQLRANPGVWNLHIAETSLGAEIYNMVDGSVSASDRFSVTKDSPERTSKTLVMKDFSNRGQLLLVKRRQGYEHAKLFPEEAAILDSTDKSDEVVHVFSLATGHAYERLLKIMMLSVTKRTSSPVKFWLFENVSRLLYVALFLFHRRISHSRHCSQFLSPSFKDSAKYMAKEIGCEVEFVTYKWPEWLRGQSEKQRLIWGYKILFLDVLFPLDVKKIIYVDADQVVRGDMTELWNLDLEGAPYGYTPFCDSREETLGYQFWRTGFWKNHLRGRPYHISALYVVDLERFRRELVGDKLRATYQQLSADPNSLANLDQDLPNYAQHDVRIFSLPQKWLWCESWCSDETKAEAMTIDLCNNPEHKEAKISMAKRIISGELFEESWEELDAEVDRYNEEFLASQ